MPSLIFSRHILVMLAIGLLMTAGVKANDASSGHPLQGKIWDTSRNNFVEKSDIIGRLQKIDYLLLGERHDNPEHHQHQVWFLEQLAKFHKNVSVAFEMIDQQQGRSLKQHRFDSANDLIQLLDQHPNGWDYQQHYRSLFAIVLDKGFGIEAANMNRQQLRKVLQSNEGIDPAYQRLLGDIPLTPVLHASLKQEIEDSHCNMLDQDTVSLMVRAQRLRDAVMARALINSEQPVKVLIAGNGHVRNDRGVPIYLDAGSVILSVGFIETAPTRRSIRDYTNSDDGNVLPYDFAWFTSGIERGDPCEEFPRRKRDG